MQSTDSKAWLCLVQVAQHQRLTPPLEHPVLTLQRCQQAGMLPWLAPRLLMQSCLMMQTQKQLLQLLTGPVKHTQSILLCSSMFFWNALQYHQLMQAKVLSSALTILLSINRLSTSFCAILHNCPPLPLVQPMQCHILVLAFEEGDLCSIPLYHAKQQ